MLVARRHLDLLLALAALEGIPSELLAPHPEKWTLRVPWDVVVRGTDLLAEAAGGAGALADSAAALLPGPEVSLLAQGEASPDTLLKFVVQQLFPGDFPLMTWRHDDPGGGASTAVVVVHDGYPSCPAFFLLLAATIRSLPRLFDLPDASVATTTTERGAHFSIKVPRISGSRRRRTARTGRATDDAPAGLRVLIDDGHDQKQARDRTMHALELAGTRLAKHDSLEPVADIIVHTLAETLGLEFVWLWGSTPARRRSRKLAGIGERDAAPSRAIPLVSGGTRLGYLEIPATSELSEWLEAAAPWIAAELSRSSSPFAASSLHPAAPRAKAWTLTPRQSDVLELLAAGLSNKEIVDSLDCSVTTVEEHLTALYRKAGVTGRHPLLAALLKDV